MTQMEFRMLVVLLLKNVLCDLELPAVLLEAYLYDKGSISIISPDLDPALSQKGRFLLAMPLFSHSEQTLSPSCMMLFFLWS